MLGAMTSEGDLPAAELTIEHVLVPLDGSEFALAAMPTARVLAERFDAELQTVSVAGRHDDGDGLAALGAAALGVGVGDRRARVVAGDDPAEAITARAAELGSCLVCLSTHGRGRLSGAVVGSVAREVLRRSSDPVVALGPSADRPGWSPARHWPPPLSVQRIVACVDGSSTSEEVLAPAAAWARALAMALSIVTVAEDAPPPLRPDAGKSRYAPSGDAATYIDELVERWQGRAADVNGEVVLDPISPASGLRTHLAQEPAGLVAVTSHVRSGIKRVMLGATAASIVHASEAPCLVVPLRGT